MSRRGTIYRGCFAYLRRWCKESGRHLALRRGRQNKARSCRDWPNREENA